MSELKINPVFKNLIPPLSEDEYKGLEENIVADGKVRDAIVAWQGVIVDGHNRFEIAGKHDLPYEVFNIDFEDENIAKVWILDNQLGRRNISTFVRIELAQLKEPLVSAIAMERMMAGKKLTDPPQVTGEGSEVKKDRKERETSVQIAKIADVSHDTYTRAKKILEKAPPEILKELREGKRSIHETERELRVGSRICECCGEEKPLSRFQNEGGKKCLDCKKKKSTIQTTPTLNSIISAEIAEKPQSQEVEPVTASETVEATDDAVDDDNAYEDYDNEESEEPKAFEDVEGEYEDSEENDVPDVDTPSVDTPVASEKISANTPQNTNLRSIAGMALGTINLKTAEDSKEHRDDLQKARDNVKQMAEYSRNHKRTIEEFQQVFQANAKKTVESLEHQFRFMDAETWADPTNKKIACDQLDELVQAITNFKEEFLLWKS